MFSKALQKLSSLAIKSTKLTPRSNPIMKALMKVDAVPTTRWMNNESNVKYELPPLTNFDLRETQLPVMIPPRISFFFKIFVDKSYNEDRFIDQAKQNMAMISTHLANDNIEGVKHMVTKKAFEELSENYKKLTTEQKSRLKIDINDILQCFSLGLRVIKRSETEFDVKILVLAEVLDDTASVSNQRILSHIRTKEFFDESPDMKMKILGPFLDNKYLCLYEFSREYGAGHTRNWVVNRLAHYTYKDAWKLLGFIE